MKESCTRIVLILCSLMLLLLPNSTSAAAEVGSPFKFTFSETFIPQGTVGCVDVVIEGFEDVTAFQLGIAYDPSSFMFSNIQSTDFDPTELFATSSTNTSGQEIITIGFADFDGATTLPDGSIGFSLCFEAIGGDGDMVTLSFSDLANGNPSQLFTGAGTFQVPDLCVIGTDVIIGDPPMNVSISTMTQAASCQSSGDGQLDIDISGGTQPYSLLVTDCDSGDIIRGPEPVGNAVVVANLNAGNYCIEITDNSIPSIIVTAMATVDNSGPSLGARFDLTEPNCNGQSNGSIEVFAILDAVEQTNPNANFNFVWTQTGGQGPIVGPNLTNIGDGNYEVEITHIATGCFITQPVFLTEPAPIVVDIAVVNETCATGGMDGEAAAVTTGGVGGYSFQWDDMNSSTDSLITGLSAGMFTVLVLDANGCPGSDTDAVTAPLPPQILGFDSLSISCPGQMDGELEVLFMDGSASVDRVEWTIPGGGSAMGARITNLGPGQYLATVIGLDNCSSSMMVTLGDVQGVTIDLMNSSVQSADCPDFTDGSISVAVSGGLGPFTLFLDNMDIGTGSNIPGLSAGDYDVFVVDANGCQSPTETFTVDRVPDIEADFIDITGVDCFEGSGGSATIVAMNGTGPYFYIWNNGETDATASSLIGGLDSVRIISGNCFLDTFVMIPQPAEIMISADIMNVSCFGEDDGEIDLDLTGGTGTFTVSANATVNGTTLTDLSADFYTVVARDANNCEKAVTLEISEPDSLDAFISDSQDISCHGEADGLLVASSTGGTGNIMYQWDSGSGDTFNSNTALAAGPYIVSVTDINGCVDTAMATIIEPDRIFALVPPIPEAPCFGEQTVINVTQATGGNGAPYTYTVNAGPAVPINSEVPVFAGDYTITVFDGRGCRETIDVTATEPPALQVNVGADQEINLGGSALIFGNINSTLDIDSIFWIESPGDSTLSCYDCVDPVANPLDDSFYELFAVDENGCTGSDEVFIKVDSDRNVYIPNAFTPYKVDGFNDFFSPFTGIGVDQVVSLEIFDRWGELVFSKENFTPGSSEAGGWDGKFKGKLASKGVYFYIANISFIDGVVLTYRGNVTVM